MFMKKPLRHNHILFRYDHLFKISRIQDGLSVQTLQEIFGFSATQAIYKWQRGSALPALDNILILSAVFRTTMDAILSARILPPDTTAPESAPRGRSDPSSNPVTTPPFQGDDAGSYPALCTHAPLAQLVERQTQDLRVSGSIPEGSTSSCTPAHGS